MRKSTAILLACAAALALYRWLAQSAPVGAYQTPAADLVGTMFEVTFGIGDKSVESWDGSINAAAGQIRRLTARLASGESIDGTRWVLHSRRASGFLDYLQPTVPVRLYALIDAPPNAELVLHTRQGDISFNVQEASAGKRLSLLNGRVQVQRVQPSMQVSAGRDDDTLPAAATAPDGRVWVAYLAYRRGARAPMPSMSAPLDQQIARGDWRDLEPKGNGDQLRLVSFDGRRWTMPILATAGGLDLWRPAVAVDGSGLVWLAWSQNDGGRWSVYRRAYDPRRQQWHAAEPISAGDGGIHVVSATDSNGAVWWAWQSWNGADYDIAVLAQRDPRFRRAVSWKTPGNQWSPAIAADHQGAVYIAWDSYEHGNYDVFLRKVAFAGVGTTITVAASARFEARPSIACDDQDRVWIAYNESGENWGKDYGLGWPHVRGVPLNLEMRAVVRVLSAGQLLETASGVPAEAVGTDPKTTRSRAAFPRLAFDGRGRMWLLYRRHFDATGEGERWVTAATSAEGPAWSQPIILGASDHTLDQRPAITVLPSGALLAVYAGDGRTRGPFDLDIDSDLYATVLDRPAPAAAILTKAVTPSKPAPTVPLARRVSEAAGGYRLLRGEFHRHTEYSSHRDWYDGALEDMWRYALDVAMLDWIGNGDHDAGYGEHAWWTIQKQSDMYHHDSVFVPMFTYERSLQYPNGHRNVMFDRRGIYPFPRYEPVFPKAGEEIRPFGGKPDLPMAYSYVKHFGGILSPHTTASGGGTDWRYYDPQAEPAVEIFQGMRNSYEHAGAPHAVAPRNAEPKGYVWNALSKGYRIAFQCGSDHVSTHISFAMVYAAQNSRKAILDAVRRRHLYGATDRIVVMLRSGNHVMGDEFAATEPPDLNVIAAGTAPIAKLDIIRGVDGEQPAYVYSAAPNQSRVELTWRDKALRGKTTFWYVRLLQEDGNIAWSTPIWVRRP